MDRCPHPTSWHCCCLPCGWYLHRSPRPPSEQGREEPLELLCCRSAWVGNGEPTEPQLWHSGLGAPWETSLLAVLCLLYASIIRLHSLPASAWLLLPALTSHVELLGEGRREFQIRVTRGFRGNGRDAHDRTWCSGRLSLPFACLPQWLFEA